MRFLDPLTTNLLYAGGYEWPSVNAIVGCERLKQGTGNALWRDAIAKEMKNVMPTFIFCDDDKVPTGYKKIYCHMVYDVKIDLTWKANLVAGGHQTDVPKESVYLSVVSRYSVRIAFTIFLHNDLNALAANVQHEYLNAPTK
jgi:hypothetical protein